MRRDRPFPTSLARIAGAAFAIALPSACGGGSLGSLPSALAPASDGPPIASSFLTPTDDWTTFAHDAIRSGYQPQATGLTTTNVLTLNVRWTAHLGIGTKASPLVANGRVYVAGRNGTVAALDVRTGSTLWSVTGLGDIQLTPTLAGGLLFVGNHDFGATLYALDADTGAIRWRSGPYAGGLRGAPLVQNGVVYFGEAGGDPDAGCRHGGVHAVQEQTGSPLWTWYVNPNAGDGGAVWSPISSAGDGITFGSGNTCSLGIAHANALVHLDATGHLIWAQQVEAAAADDDFGGAALLLHGRAIAIDKDGTLYARDAATGALSWSTSLNTLDGYGGIGSPATDGKVLVVSAGYVADPTKTAVPGGTMVGVDLSGNKLWSLHSASPNLGAVAISNGIAFATLDATYVALDIRSGKKLWSVDAGTTAFASPAVVPSGVYFANDAGDVSAYALPSAAVAAATRARR